MEKNQITKDDLMLGGWINEKRAMEVLNAKKSTLYHLRKNKYLKYSRIGLKLFYSIDSIINLLNDNARNTTK